MPLAYRHRLGLTLGGAVVAAAIALLSAAPAAAAGPSVTFTGSCGLLGVLAAASKPDRSTVSVPAGSAVVFVNNMSDPAQLRLDNQPAGTVAKGKSITKVFENGPVAVTLVPDCLLDNLAAVKATTVAVTSGPAPGSTAPASVGTPARPASGGQGLAEPQQRPPAQGGVPPAGAQPVLSLPAPGALPAGADAAESEPPAAARAAEPEPVTRHGASSVLVVIAMASIVVASIAAIRAMLAKRAARAVGA
jgi:hypothetical protein